MTKTVILALLTHKVPNKQLAQIQIWGQIAGWHKKGAAYCVLIRH